MPKNLWSCRMILLAVVLMIPLMTTSRALVSSSWADAADETESDPMARQRRDYQSEYNLVKAVQKRLDVCGYHPGPMDGVFGPRTKAALTAFQMDNGLRVDGAIGIETLMGLDLIRKME